VLRLLLPGANGVGRLLLKKRLSVPLGTQIRLTIQALHKGHPARGKIVSIFDGARVWSARTNRNGLAKLTIAPALTTSVVVFSGSTWRTMTLKWTSPPVTTIKLTIVPSKPRHRATIVATLRGTQGPAAGAPVTITIAAAHGASMTRSVRANRGGRGSVSFTIPRGPVIVTATSYGTSATLRL
jgi:hypothetical protein